MSPGHCVVQSLRQLTGGPAARGRDRAGALQSLASAERPAFPPARGRSGMILFGSAQRRGRGMGTARPVMEECFHQPLFALPKGSERCWGTLPSVVQRKPPHAKMLSPELFKTFLWKPNASTGRGLQPPCPAAPPPPPGAVSPSLTTANGAACTEAPRRGSHRPTQAEGALTPPSQNRVQTQREETPPPVSSTPSAGGGGAHGPGRRHLSPVLHRPPACMGAPRAEPSPPPLWVHFTTRRESLLPKF